MRSMWRGSAYYFSYFTSRERGWGLFAQRQDDLRE